MTNAREATLDIDRRQLRRYLRHGTLPQLAALDEAMRQGSFSRAAESLHMAQPTLSGHIRKLSDALGVELFESHGRHRLPTPAAVALQQAAADIFHALARADGLLRQLR